MSTLRTDNLQTTDSAFTIPVNQLVSQSQLTAVSTATSRVVASIAALKLVSKLTATHVQTQGYYVPGDRGNSDYELDLTDTTSVGDNFLIVVANDGGRWKIVQNGPLSLRQAGCKGDGVTDDTVGYLAAINSGRNIRVPQGDFLVSPVGPSASYPGAIGFLRTSAAILSSGQTITGEGDSSILRWGSATLQAFFLVKQAVGVRIDSIKFIGGHSSLVVDPLTDGAVDSVTINNCSHEGQAQGVCGGRQIALDPTGSKFHTNFVVSNCRFKNMPEHSIMVSNVYRYRIFGNDFRNSTGGYCVDQSQGSRGGAVYDNTADNVLYFTKIESTNVAGGTASVSESHECSVRGNIVTNLAQYGVLVSSNFDRIVIADNTFIGSTTQTIIVDAVTGYAHDGQMIIVNNIIRTATGGTGIRVANVGQAFLPPLIEGNNIYASVAAIDYRIHHGNILNNILMSADGNAVNIGTTGSPIVDCLKIQGNLIKSITSAGITGQNTVVWQRVLIQNNDFYVTTFAIYAPNQVAMRNCNFSNNTVHYAASTTNDAFQLNNVSASIIDNNIFNLVAGTGRAIATFGTTTKTRVANNVATVAVFLGSPDASTTATSIGNITDATYFA